MYTVLIFLNTHHMPFFFFKGLWRRNDGGKISREGLKGVTVYRKIK